MLSEKLVGDSHDYVQIQPETAISSTYSFLQCGDVTRIFEELPTATIVSVSGPEAADHHQITPNPMLFTYTIELQYKQFRWCLQKKATQVLYLHFALKKRAIIEEFHEKQEQVREWLQSLGIGDLTAVVQAADAPDDEAVPLHSEESVKNRYVPSRAALPIIKPALGVQQISADKAKSAMQGYLSHFLGNMDIVNSREVCKFLGVSKLSFLQDYGPKLKEDYVMVRHLPKISREDASFNCWEWLCFSCCSGKWQKVWVVLKPGFLALLEDPFDTKLLDIIVFDVLPASTKKAELLFLATEIKEQNPLCYSLKVNGGSRCIKLRTTTSNKAKEWVAAINDTALRPLEGWCQPHRFGSFAPPRGLTDDNSHAQWFIDGQAAFDAVAAALEDAQSEIFITGWWLCPELYLRRPFHIHGSSRLDALLEAKAKQGVQIYILLYKEVPISLKIKSSYSKKRLLEIHENVRVLRYPDHFSTGVYLWSHHEKLVLIDHQICFIGGLDLCFGRYDTREHKVGDWPPHIWPGKDYYNPRESEPNSWVDTMKDELDRERYPRMPWHDVHCALWGPPCRDVARHFVQRWNYAKRNKAPNEQTIPLLMPQQHMVLPHYMGRSSEKDTESKSPERNQNDINRLDSFSSRSPTEDIPLLLPQEANAPDASNIDQKLNFMEMNCDILHQPMNHDINQASILKSKVGPFISDSQEEMDDYDSMAPESETNSGELLQSDVQSSDEWWETQERGHLVDSTDETGQVGPRTPCRCQIVRSVSQWSAGTSQTEESIHHAYCSLIEKAEHFVYIENQFFISGLSGDEIIQNRVLEALYRRILLAHKEQKYFRVIVVIPLVPGFQGGIDDSGAATVRAIMHWQYRTICRGKNSILHNLNEVLGSKMHDYISFYGLRTHGRLFEGGPIATSQVYVHSKVMIVDDRVALVGSSNINDRSLLGSRDSEIGVIIEDKDFVESTMNGKAWSAGKFSHSLRLSLWSEHLGLQAEEVSQIMDPIADTTYRDLWMARAKTNTMIYQDVFSCIPNDLIHSRAALRQSMVHWKEKLGHTTIDLGIAPKKLESYNCGEVEVTDTMERLQSVRGFLVCFPLEFMRQAVDLRPVFNEGEFYAGPQVFH
ncbi:Phospholipase D/Transphosphatidylase [Dillenia turbinata]|uniref:Phospholipase n=1 Tax=Dillenia turbinata TaxID=194707 RepID=A0AAN8YVW9_9MAGN